VDFEEENHYFSEKNFPIFRKFFLFRVSPFRKKSETEEKGRILSPKSPPVRRPSRDLFIEF